MTQLVTESRSRVALPLHAWAARKGRTDAQGSVLHPLTVLGLAVTLALVAAMIELAMHFIRRKFINPSSLGALQLNPQAYWMVPVSDILILGGCGLLVAAAAGLAELRKLCTAGIFGLFFVSAIRGAADVSRPERSACVDVCCRSRVSAHGSASGPPGA